MDWLGPPRPFRCLAADRSSLETAVVCWLVGCYGRPFVWFRAGGVPLVVS